MKHFHNGKIYAKEAENPPILIQKKFCNKWLRQQEGIEFNLDQHRK